MTFFNWIRNCLLWEARSVVYPANPENRLWLYAVPREPEAQEQTDGLSAAEGTLPGGEEGV